MSRCRELGNVLIKRQQENHSSGKYKVYSAADPAEQWLEGARSLEPQQHGWDRCRLSPAAWCTKLLRQGEGSSMAGWPLTIKSRVLPPTSPRMPGTRLSAGQRAVSSPRRRKGELKPKQGQMRGHPPHHRTLPAKPEGYTQFTEKGHLNSSGWEKITIPYRNR